MSSNAIIIKESGRNKGFQFKFCPCVSIRTGVTARISGTVKVQGSQMVRKFEEQISCKINNKKLL